MKVAFSSRRREQTRGAVGAFTLVEVGAVIAVLAVLMVVTVPAMKGGIVAGQRTECASNLRQVGTALLLYANDNDGWLPGTSHTMGNDLEGAWIYAVGPYLDNVDEVRICPADPKAEERLAAKGTSYILNSFVFVPRVGPFGEMLPGSMNNVRQISEPSKTLFAGNISDRLGASTQNDHTHSERWGGEDGAGGSWSALCADIQPDRFTTGAKSDHTAGSANYLFADGHVENLPARVVKERLEKGDNIARPPGA